MNGYTVENSTNEDSTLKLTDNPFSLPLEISNFDSDKDHFKFIKNVEKLIRSSIEYRDWVNYVTDSLGHRECVLTKESMSECSLDVHHHPINLFNICYGVIDKYVNSAKKFTTFEIAEEVIRLHFQNKVGYMILLSDIHEKFHNGFQSLPIEFVHGDYKYLLDNYNYDEVELAKISEYCKVTTDKIKLSWSKDNYPGLMIVNENLKPEVPSTEVKSQLSMYVKLPPVVKKETEKLPETNLFLEEIEIGDT